MKLAHLFEALRPSQWIKNVSIFAAAILTGQLTNPVVLINSILAFIAYCSLSSSSYLINDLVDVAKDRLHPTKKNRPIARRDISRSTALNTAFILAIFGLSLAFVINFSFFSLSAVFILLQYSYTLIFKRKAVFDILGIALFFIIRAYAGELATGWHLPVWIMMTVIFLSLFIASGKRRSELVKTGTKTRTALSGYSRSLLNFYTTMFGVSTLISYALFTYNEKRVEFDGILHSFLLSNSPNLIERRWYMVTLIPIIFGIMRYGQIIFEMEEGERPEKIIANDIPLIMAIFLWGIMMLTIIYVL